MAQFRAFYGSNSGFAPPQTPKREFGTGDFGRKISRRHLSFESDAAFDRFLALEAPFFVSYSAACYEYPANRPMAAKNWLGSDLIYEFDADDLALPCQQEHDFWTCKECGASGRGRVRACTSCASAAVAVSEWVCEKCLEGVKKEVFRLVRVLETEFGFSDGLSFNFSGSKGFHVHVRSDAVYALSPRSRIELLDYLTGTNLDMAALGFVEQKKMLYATPFAQAKGWSFKLLSSLRDLLIQHDSARLAAAGGVSVKIAQKVLSQDSWSTISRGVFPAVSAGKGVRFWTAVLEFLADEIRLPVDRQTSMDAYKIIRVPDTLHGSTGLASKKIAFNSLLEFNGLRDAVVFGDEPLGVWVKKTPRFVIGNESFGPFENSHTQLPLFAAVFLLCRSAATLQPPLEAPNP